MFSCSFLIIHAALPLFSKPWVHAHHLKKLHNMNRKNLFAPFNCKYAFCITTQFTCQYCNLILTNRFFTYVSWTVFFLNIPRITSVKIRSDCYVLFYYNSANPYTFLFHYAFGFLKHTSLYLWIFLLHFVPFLSVLPLKLDVFSVSVPKILKLPSFVFMK